MMGLPEVSMIGNRPVEKVRIVQATPRDPASSDKLPWYSDLVKYTLREYGVYLDDPNEFELVDPTVAGLGPQGYAAISRCDAVLVA